MRPFLLLVSLLVVAVSTACGGTCEDPESDPTCPRVEPRPRCEEGWGDCGDKCVDLSKDLNNCGTCGNVCLGSASICAAGSCGCPSENPYARGCNGMCVNVFNDPDHCGACGNICPEGQRRCYGGGCF
jgi:hypothetical protein